MQKNAKFLSVGGSAPRPPELPPLCEFLATRLDVSKQVKIFSLNPKFLEVSKDLFRIIDVTTANSNENFIDCIGLFYILDIINVNLTENFRAVLQS